MATIDLRKTRIRFAQKGGPDIAIGADVMIEAIMERNKMWLGKRREWVRQAVVPIRGVYIGWRKVTNGEYRESDGIGWYREDNEMIVLMVVINAAISPVYVLEQDMKEVTR